MSDHRGVDLFFSPIDGRLQHSRCGVTKNGPGGGTTWGSDLDVSAPTAFQDVIVFGKSESGCFLIQLSIDLR